MPPENFSSEQGLRPATRVAQKPAWPNVRDEFTQQYNSKAISATHGKKRQLDRIVQTRLCHVEGSMGSKVFLRPCEDACIGSICGLEECIVFADTKYFAAVISRAAISIDLRFVRKKK